MFSPRFFSGFTFIEVLITLGLVAVLAIASIPAFKSIIDSNRLKTASEHVYQALEFARTEAIKQRTDVHINFQTGSNWCFGSRVNSSCNCAIPGSCTLSSIPAANYANVSLITSGFSSADIVFDGVRGTIAQTGSVTLSLSGKSFTITMGKMGRLQVCSTDVWGYPAC